MRVRPIVPADEEAYRSILERTTAEDRYCRFFHLVDHFDPDEIHRFVEARPDMIGVLAEDDDGNALGAAHAALLDAESAELAIVVARDARRRGVATAMVQSIIVMLEARGYRRLIGCALRENRPFVHLAKRFAFVPEMAEGAAVRWVRPLDGARIPG
jgi:GNAT superfamily N-acetyltransferase